MFTIRLLDTLEILGYSRFVTPQPADATTSTPRPLQNSQSGFIRSFETNSVTQGMSLALHSYNKHLAVIQAKKQISNLKSQPPQQISAISTL